MKIRLHFCTEGGNKCFMKGEENKKLIGCDAKE